MSTVIRIARPEGWHVSPRGAHTFFPQGDYRVPEEMSAELARRCLTSGIGREVSKPPQTKNNKKPGKRKKKPSKIKTGPKRS